MAFDPRLGYDPKVATASAQGRIKYKNPGPTVDYYDPEVGLTLKPYFMEEILPPELQPDPMENFINDLIKSMSPSGRPAASPASTNLLDKFMSMAPSGVGDKYFSDLIGRIGAPSSVDEVQKSLETESIKQMLEQIDLDTAGTLATTKLDAQARGLGGPGQYGDIEANALAQVRSGADKTKAAVRLGGYQSELARKKAKEDALTQAFSKRYEVGTSQDSSTRQILASLLGTEFQGGITQKEGALNREATERVNYFNQLLDYAVKKGTLSQADAQFYAKLISTENIAAADRESAYNRALLAKQGGGKDWLDYLTGAATALKGFTGAATDVYSMT